MTLATFSTPSKRTPPPQTRWPLTPAEEAAMERAVRVYLALGWPVRVHPSARRVTVAIGRRMNALSMPKPIGVLIAEQLTESGQPVVALSGGHGWWTLLTGPRPRETEVTDELLDAGIRAVPRGAQVVLPVVGLPNVKVNWVYQPHAETGLPSHTAILALAYRVARRQPPLLPR